MCDGCEFYTLESVPAAPFIDPSGEIYGFTKARLCIAGPGDFCRATKAMIRELDEIPPDVDFGDGVLSPEEELRKAALNRGRP